MTGEIVIDVDLGDLDGTPSATEIESWVRAVLEHQQEHGEVSVALLSEEAIQQLNRDYRGKDQATNVLSFPADIPDFVDLKHLGDILICPSVVRREAQEQGKQESAHWAHMVVHGCLHLLGYDHIEDDQAEQMESLETVILAKLGYPAPYIV